MILTGVVIFSFILFELELDADLFGFEFFFDVFEFFHLFEFFHFDVDLIEFEFLDVELGFFQVGFFQLEFFELEFGFFQLEFGFFELEFLEGLSPNVSPFSHRPCDKFSFCSGFFADCLCLLVLHFGLLPPGFLNHGLLLQYGFRKLSSLVNFYSNHHWRIKPLVNSIDFAFWVWRSKIYGADLVPVGLVKATLILTEINRPNPSLSSFVISS